MKHGANGHSQRELEWLRLGVEGCHRGRGWHYPSVRTHEVPSEDVETLHALMMVGSAAEDLLTAANRAKAKIPEREADEHLAKLLIQARRRASRTGANQRGQRQKM